MPLQVRLAALRARLRGRLQRTQSSGRDAIETLVVPSQQLSPIPGTVKMDRLPEDVIQEIFRLLIESLGDVTNAMTISVLWHKLGDKVLHKHYSSRAALFSPRRHLYPFTKLVFTIDDAEHHAHVYQWIEPEHLEIVFNEDVYITKYLNPNLRHLRVSCTSSLIPFNQAAVELADEFAALATREWPPAERHGIWLPAVVESSQILERLILDMSLDDVPLDTLAYLCEHAISLRHLELLCPSNRIQVRAGLLPLLANVPTMRTLRLDYIITLADVQHMLQSSEWQNSSHFRDLESLTCRLEVGAADILLTRFSTLRHLEMTLYDQHSLTLPLLANVFARISKLDNLESLTIILPNNVTKLLPQALMALGYLKYLRELRINSFGPLRCGLSWDELTTLVSRWTDLKKLNWSLVLA